MNSDLELTVEVAAPPDTIFLAMSDVLMLRRSLQRFARFAEEYR